MLPKTKSKPKHTLSDLTALVYGPSKIGKSTWCSKADDALFLATEPGLNALEVFQTPITCWDDLLQACAEIAEGKHEFKTIVVDTVDNAYKMCSDYVCKKFKIEHESDLGYGKGLRADQQRVPARHQQARLPALWADPDLPLPGTGHRDPDRQTHPHRADAARKGAEAGHRSGGPDPVLRPGHENRRGRQAGLAARDAHQAQSQLRRR